MRVCMYLRKSRADLDKEQYGIDTLAAHKKILLEYAKKKKLNVIDIKEEIVSGGQLFNRTEMLKLLAEAEENKFDAVLCMDIDRLGRSGMKDQGIILDTFKEHDIKIITPQKVYDLNNESDMLHTDVKSFIARQELNLIKSRLYRGRVSIAKDGFYVHGTAPFGYKKIKSGKYNTLEIVPEEAKIIKMIFDMYVNEDKGAIQICDELVRLGLKNASGNLNWSTRTIKKVIHNETYAGKVTFAKRTYKASREGTKSKINPDYISVEGKHEGIISYDLWLKAQDRAKARYNPPAKINTGIRNPLAGLIKCSCGYAMTIKEDYKALRLVCSKRCGTAGTNIIRVEKRLIDDLRKHYNNLKADVQEKTVASKTDALMHKKSILEENIKKKEQQINKTYELLEQEIYNTDTFLKRNGALLSELEKLKDNLEILDAEIKNEEKNNDKETLIPQLGNILDIYYSLPPEGKNKLLKSTISKITYYKERGAKPDDFNLKIELKISK